MNFVFISPNFPENYAGFCVGLKENGVNVLGIGDCPYEHLSDELKLALTEYYLVDSLENYDDMIRAVGYFTGRYGKIDWIESNNEYWLTLDAALRTDFNVPTGYKTEDIVPLRRKSKMKEYYESAGIPTARWIMAEDEAEALSFAAKTGYPLVAKPDSGVGAEDTFRLDNEKQLRDFFADRPETPYIIEEYVKGEVTTFDGIANSKGEVLFSVSHITPESIMDMVNEHKPVYYYVDREVPADVKDAGMRALKAFGIRRRFFHLEFFRLTEGKEGLGKAGDIIGLEANLRPAGGFTPDMINFSQSCDCFRIWADMVAFDECRRVYDGEKRYCLCVGRRDDVTYKNDTAVLREKYGSRIVLDKFLAPALARAMGNRILLVLLDTKEEMDEFLRDAFSPMKIRAIGKEKKKNGRRSKKAVFTGEDHH